MSSYRTFLLDLIQPFRQLDVCTPGILDERDGNVQRRNLRVGALQLDAVGLELLGERFEVLDLEADMVDRAALRADDGRGRGREIERDSRQIRRHERRSRVDR